MDIVAWAIKRPVSVAVGVMLVVMFGLIGLGAIPIQLTPTVDRPIITVTTTWPGRSPQEVVDEITREQEKRLKNVANLKRMRSTSQEGLATISLEFYLGTDIGRALQEVSDSLRQVPAYPAEVDEPIIKAAEGASENAIAWIIIDLKPEARARHPDYDITTVYDALDKEVKPYLERIDGVAEVNIYGGREREVRVQLDPLRLSQRRLSPLDVIEALRAENRNVSAGTIAEGKRDYRVRVTGQFVTAEDILGAVIAYRDGKPVYVRDVGDAEIGYKKHRGFVRSLGAPCIAMNVIRQSNANVVEVMAELRARLEEVRSDILPLLTAAAPGQSADVGPDLRMRQVYDETTYIDSAIDLVLNNLWQGGLIAVLVLLLFLRSTAATGLIAIAIPISVIGTFLVMVAFGRTLNVISLAGLAFATGMVVDNAVVVLENIYRRLQVGDAPRQAAYRGGKEVWGAILASTLTTIAVFIPVLTIKEEAGQLFRDISLAIAASVTLSLIVSITVIPSAAARVIRRPPNIEAPGTSRLLHHWHILFGLAPLLARAVRALGDLVFWASTGWRAWTLRPVIVAAMAAGSILGMRALIPPLDYLPTGNRNLVFGGLLIPPGYSVEQQTRIAERLEAIVGPYVAPDAGAGDNLNVARDTSELPPIPRFDPAAGKPLPPFDPVRIENFFIGAFGGAMFAGAVSADEEVVIPVGQLLTNAMNTIPDAFGGARQAGIFATGADGGNSVNVEISGPHLDRVIAAAQMVFATAAQTYGYGNVRPSPANFNLTQPEWRVVLNDRGRELGLTTRDIGTAVRGLFDGAFVDDFRLGAETVDLVVVPIGGELPYKELLASTPIATPAGPIVPLDSVVTLIEASAPQEISRVEELPAVTIQVTPREGSSVEEVVADLRDNIIAQARAAGLIDPTMRIRYEGTAAKLDEVTSAMFGRADGTPPDRGWRRAVLWLSCLIAAAGVAVGAYTLFVGARRRSRPGGRLGPYAAGALGALLMAVAVGGLFFGLAHHPHLATARFVWALLVTYLLMSALFESFLYPLVIMFSVPLAIVGGFAALRLLHEWTLRIPWQAPQQLDVVTMLGFVILIGTVVNNAILLVERALQNMRPSDFGDDAPPMEPLAAIAQSVRERARPIFMTTLTTVGGMTPLVVAPGAGSEMYRGLGAVVLGGLLVSTVFTLLLVPLVFSLVIQMREGLFLAFSPAPAPAAAAPGRVAPPVHDRPVLVAANGDLPPAPSPSPAPAEAGPDQA